VSGGPKILIADDSPLVLRMIEKMLTTAGFTVVTAPDGIEAIDKALHENVSLVILDLMMPRMNGYQACRILKTEDATRSVPVIILTSKDHPGDRFWGLETGADYFITKDAEPQLILELVRKVVASGEVPPRPPLPEGQRTSVDILSRINALLDRKLFETTILSEIGRVARKMRHFDEAFTSIMGIVARVVDFTVGAMAFVDNDDLDVLLVLQRPAAPPVVEEAKARLLEAIARERGGASFSKVQARLFTPENAAARAHNPEKVLGGFFSVPITIQDRLAALLALGGKAAARISADNEAFLVQVANQSHIVMENSRLLERLRILSIRDGLTDLYNHRHAMEMVSMEFERVGRYEGGRYEGGVSLLMIDIDHFKKINDQHGHPTGDMVLKEVARRLKDTLRTVDAIARYGGEEFLVILPHTQRSDALQTAERLRKAIEEHPFRAGGRELRATISVGVASYPAGGIDTPEALIRGADEALYKAKQTGRNRVA
jgi:two-component system cell cycle response regulator